MRAQRLVEGGLLLATFVLGDVRPAYVALALLAMQAVISPLASPIALVWAIARPTVTTPRLGDLYYDRMGTRGAAAISSAVIAGALYLVHAGYTTAGQILLGAPCASCLLAATVGFCAGCGYYVLGRDLLVRASVLRGAPEGTCDVDLDHPDQHELRPAP